MRWSSRKKKECIFCNVYFVRRIFFFFFFEQLYNNKITIATTSRSSLLELFLKAGAPQKYKIIEKYLLRSSKELKCIEYWIYFYISKSITSLLLLVFKIVESLQRILKLKQILNKHWFDINLSKTTKKEVQCVRNVNEQARMQTRKRSKRLNFGVLRMSSKKRNGWKFSLKRNGVISFTTSEIEDVFLRCFSNSAESHLKIL